MNHLSRTQVQTPCPECGDKISREWSYCASCGSPRKRQGSSSRRLNSFLLMELVVILAAIMLPHLVRQRHSARTTRAGAALTASAFQVPGGQWLDTGLVIPAGATVRIHASGVWNPWSAASPDLGPDGLDEKSPEGRALLSSRSSRLRDRVCDTAAWGAIVGRIGAGPYFPITSDCVVTVSEGGALVVGMNDDARGGAADDNTGQLEVTVSGEYSRSVQPETLPFPKREE